MTGALTDKVAGHTELACKPGGRGGGLRSFVAQGPKFSITS